MSSSPTRLVVSPRTKVVLRRKGGIELQALVSPGRKKLQKRTPKLRKPPGRHSTGSEDLQTADFLQQEIDFLQGVEVRYSRLKSLERELAASRAQAEQLRAQVNWYHQIFTSLAENCNDDLYRLDACSSLKQSLPPAEPCDDLFLLIQKTAERLETWRLRVNS